MLEAAADWLWDELRDEVGDRIRIVTVYEGVELTSRVRDDVLYRDEVARKIIDENIVDGYSEQRLEEKMGVGSLDGVIRYYRDIYAVNWARSETPQVGILVSIDRTGDLEGFEDVHTVVNFLSEHGPRAIDRGG